jgi:predicted lipid-binding transport protein (Tim44 family)
MDERREAAGLSTADMARAAQQPTEDPDTASTAQQSTDDRGMSPKYIQDEETAALPRTGDAIKTGAPRTGAPPLLPQNELDGFRSRWADIQGGFVDEPRRAVEQADGLVAEVIKRLAEVFAGERDKLEDQWGRGDDVDTEELRVALQRYRSFFERLLAA